MSGFLVTVAIAVIFLALTFYQSYAEKQRLKSRANRHPKHIRTEDQWLSR